MDLVELSRRLENLIRFGTIHSVDHAARKARVQTGYLVTQWLPWIESRAGETTTWNPPTIGEQCVVFSPSGEPAGGMIFYGVPSDQIDTPSHDPVKHVIKYPDGAKIEYDHASGHLEAIGIKTGLIQAATSITFDTPLTHITGQCVVDQLLTYKNGLAGTGGSNGNAISGNLTHSNGNITKTGGNIFQVAGNFTHTGGSLSSNGIVLHTHHHQDTGGPL